MTVRPWIDRRMWLKASVAGLCAWMAGPSWGSELAPSRVLELPWESGLDRRPVVTAIALSADGQMLASGGDDHHVQIWNVAEGKLIARFEGHTDWVRSLAFHPDGARLISTGDDQQLRIWEVATGRTLRSAMGHDGVLYSLAVSPPGDLVAVAGFTRRIFLYQGETGSRARVLDHGTEDVRALAFSPDGKRLAAGGRDGHIRIWEAESGQILQDIRADKERIRALAWSADGSLLVSGGEGTHVRMWDPASGAKVQEMVSRPGQVMSVVFCGDRLAAGDTQNRIRVWTLDGREERQLTGHTGSVAALTYDAQTASVVSGGFDTTVRWWHLEEAPVDDTAAQPELAPRLR